MAARLMAAAAGEKSKGVSFADDKEKEAKAAAAPPSPIDQACAAMKASADALFAKGDAAGAAVAYTELLAKLLVRQRFERRRSCALERNARAAVTSDRSLERRRGMVGGMMDGWGLN